MYIYNEYKDIHSYVCMYVVNIYMSGKKASVHMNVSVPLWERFNALVRVATYCNLWRAVLVTDLVCTVWRYWAPRPCSFSKALTSDPTDFRLTRTPSTHNRQEVDTINEKSYSTSPNKQLYVLKHYYIHSTVHNMD